MKRDLELIRQLMLSVELRDDSFFTGNDIDIEDYNLSQINRHLQWLCEANLIDGKATLDGAGDICVVIMSKLSWEGCNFLDNARNESVWKKTMATVKEKGESVGFPILTQILVSYTKQHFGLS
jgi:Hypothetical protein (DUF2513)